MIEIPTPIMIDNYRARCCGTCKNVRSLYDQDYECGLDDLNKNPFSICMSYEMRE